MVNSRNSYSMNKVYKIKNILNRKNTVVNNYPAGGYNRVFNIICLVVIWQKLLDHSY